MKLESCKFAVAAIFFLLSNVQGFSQNLDRIIESNLISLDLKEQKLKSVADDILKQTGYTVIYDSKWSDLPISGHYQNATLEQFFFSAIRNNNKCLAINEKDKVATLTILGDVLTGEKPIITQTQDNTSETRQNSIKSLQEQQAKERDEYRRSQKQKIEKLHTEQQIERQKSMEDPKSMDPISGLTRAQEKEIQDAQKAEMEKYRTNPNSVDPRSGLTNAEIFNLQKSQSPEFKQFMESDSDGVPFGLLNKSLNNNKSASGK